MVLKKEYIAFVHCIQTETYIVINKIRKLVKHSLPLTILTTFDWSLPKTDAGQVEVC